jgi:hypothetical protein
MRIDFQCCRLQREMVCRRRFDHVATEVRAGFTRSHSHGARLRRGAEAGFFRTLVGRPLITMKPPLRTLPACMGTVVEAPDSAVSNSSTSSWSDIVQENGGQQDSLGWFRVRCARQKGRRQSFLTHLMHVWQQSRLPIHYPQGNCIYQVFLPIQNE